MEFFLKPKVGTSADYECEESSDDEFPEVQIRKGCLKNGSEQLFDEGDAALAELGTTPPRTRYRDKQKRQTLIDAGFKARRPMLKNVPRCKSVNSFYLDQNYETRDRMRTISRAQDRNFKSASLLKHHRTDSLPSPGDMPAIPTLVESCNKFNCLTSKLKCREEYGFEKREEVETELPQNQVDFHRTFSLLINMGNVEKGCRRTISREEQVWQNELKDLIWLEIQARLSQRTLEQQDDYLCKQREIVPAVIQNILDYQFVNYATCESSSKPDIKCSADGTDEVWSPAGCLSFTCRPCSDSVGRALKEVATLLDSYYNAVSLYPSSKAMMNEHPVIAENHFKNRLKAMCLWYNIVMHLRLKLLVVKDLVRCMKDKENNKECIDGYGCELDPHRATRVRFEATSDLSASGSENSDRGAAVQLRTDRETTDQVATTNDNSEPPTPEVVIFDTSTGLLKPSISYESGYTSEQDGTLNWRKIKENVVNLGPLNDIADMKLLNPDIVSPYRSYHLEVLKTQGVRRSMMFIDKLRNNTLKKLYMTFEKSESDSRSKEPRVEGETHVFNDSDHNEDEDLDDVEDYELRRYGCQSEECKSMRLPSYRSHFLLLSTICLEAIHDYLTLRRDTRPPNPSCLTVKQIIHELKEGLDIAVEMRALYLRDIKVTKSKAEHLDRAFVEFGNTLHTELQQYFSYLKTMSDVEFISRGRLEKEWSFTTKLALKVKYASELAPDSFTDIVCNQLNRQLKQFEDKFTALSKLVTEIPNGDAEATRQAVCEITRETQSLYAQEREPCLQTAHFARTMASRLSKAPNNAFRAQRDRIFTGLMSIRDCISSQIQQIVKYSAPDDSRDKPDGLQNRTRELLLQVYRFGFELHKDLYKFVHSPIKSRDKEVFQRPVSLQPIKQKAFDEKPERPKTLLFDVSVLHREIQRAVPPNSCKRPTLLRLDSLIEDDTHKIFENVSTYNGQNTGLTAGTPLYNMSPLRNSAIIAPKQSPALSHPSTNDQYEKVARAIIEFARFWMNFVMERCERGRGRRPRWASQGLEFLMLACDPYNTKHLSDTEFEELKSEMDRCISHVVGRRPAPGPPSPATPPVCGRKKSPLPRRHLPDGESSPVTTATNTPSSEPEPILNFSVSQNIEHVSRVLSRISALEAELDERSRAAGRAGKVVVGPPQHDTAVLARVNFKWLRGLRIGAGTYGKVYTVVNVDSGQLLAMKEIGVAAGDRRALQQAARELTLLESVVHPHLVRHYGCELHREEMLIFMELCVEGSLEELVVTHGALPEPQVRRYTLQLLSAVSELHRRQIAHRDIKSANIFLTNKGNCLKLGDFGCAVKIKDTHTALGELRGTVGTQAYMAPEVFTGTTQHGRAADVWSLGCVVTEMASGKRPFAEFDRNYQIMYTVGMGGRPKIPDTLSEEGTDFALQCLTHEPSKRPRADELTLHHFVRMKFNEDCNCQPGFFKSK